MITGTLEWTPATHTHQSSNFNQHALIYLESTFDRVVLYCSVLLFSNGSVKVPESKALPFIRVIAVLLGITRYFACSMPSSTAQPISMYREPVHFPLMTNVGCVVANEISGAEYAGIKG